MSLSLTISAASTNATSLKASPGTIEYIEVFNLNAANRYLKLFDKASAPTVGSDTPVKVIPIPGSSTAAGVILQYPEGLNFVTGIAFCLTTGVANSDTAAVGANDVVLNIKYF